MLRNRSNVFAEDCTLYGGGINYNKTAELIYVERKKMETKIFNKIRDLIYEKSGITLGECKEALVSARIGKRMRSIGIRDLNEYLEFMEKDKTGQELICMIDAISTNVTSFFREEKHFGFLKEKVMKWLDEGQRKFRFWSAASSTGEEPYTIAMTLNEISLYYNPEIRILATDISTRVLKKCIEGRYSAEKIKNVPGALKEKYFDKIKVDGEVFFSVKDVIKKYVTFSRLNLSNPPFPMKGPFDFIFCRNVMIYFDNEVRKKLLEEVCRLLKPGGFLLVGHSESLTGIIMNSLKPVMPSVYVKN